MKFHEFAIRICLLSTDTWRLAVLGGIIFAATDQSDHRVILPTLNGHGEEYQLSIMFLMEDSALEILDHVKANRGVLFAIGGASLGGQIAMNYCR